MPDRCEPAKISDDDALARLREWEAAGGPVIEESVISPARRCPRAGAARPRRASLPPRHRHLVAAHLVLGPDPGRRDAGVSSEPEVIELDDEVGDIALVRADFRPGLPSPMADLPTGAKFGTLVHAVLETADPFADDLAAELESQIREHSVWWPVDVPAAELAAALVPMHDTPLGPFANGLTLRQIGLRDRLRELDFEFPWPAVIYGSAVPDIRLQTSGRLLRRHLPADDPLAGYADRLTGDALGSQPLRGYLNGRSMRCCGFDGRAAYLVVDYKTNWLGDCDSPLTAADYDRPRMVEAMLHSDYPLQALLYSVVLHRFLRWRNPGTTHAPPGRGAVSVRARHVRAGYARWSTAIRPGCSAGSRRRRWCRRYRICSMRGGWRHDSVERWTSRTGGARSVRRVAAHLQRCGGHRGSGCACGATAYSAGRRATSGWRSLSRSWCGRCAAARCAWTGSVQGRSTMPDLPWPASDEWLGAVAASPLLGSPTVLRVR